MSRSQIVYIFHWTPSLHYKNIYVYHYLWWNTIFLLAVGVVFVSKINENSHNTHKWAMATTTKIWKNWRKFIVQFFIFWFCLYYTRILRFLLFSWIIIYTYHKYVVCVCCMKTIHLSPTDTLNPYNKYFRTISGIVFIINKYSSYTQSHNIYICFFLLLFFFCIFWW